MSLDMYGAPEGSCEIHINILLRSVEILLRSLAIILRSLEILFLSLEIPIGFPPTQLCSKKFPGGKSPTFEGGGRGLPAPWPTVPEAYYYGGGARLKVSAVCGKHMHFFHSR